MKMRKIRVYNERRMSLSYVPMRKATHLTYDKDMKGGLKY